MIKPNTLNKKKEEEYQFSIFNLPIFRKGITIVTLGTVVVSSYVYIWNVSGEVTKIKIDTQKNVTDISDLQKQDEEYDKKFTENEKDTIRIKDSIQSESEALARIEKTIKQTNDKLDEQIKTINSMQNAQAGMSSSITNIERNIDRNQK